MGPKNSVSTPQTGRTQPTGTHGTGFPSGQPQVYLHLPGRSQPIGKPETGPSSRQSTTGPSSRQSMTAHPSEQFQNGCEVNHRYIKIINQYLNKTAHLPTTQHYSYAEAAGSSKPTQPVTHLEARLEEWAALESLPTSTQIC